MAGGFIGQLVEAIMNGPEGMESASMSIVGIDPTDPAGSAVLLPERAFQFWPESIQDSIEVGWNFKEIPGASHALAQWNSNGGRTISFEVRLHRFMKPVEDRTVFEKILDPFGLTAPGNEYLKDMRPHNVDVDAEIRYLRAYCYPSYGYDVADGSTVSYPPPVACLCVPGVGLNETGGDVIYAVMTGCDVTYNLLFPNGVPRNATVALTFRQIVQTKDRGVLYRGLSIGSPSMYALRTPDTSYVQPSNYESAGRAAGSKVPAPGAGRKPRGVNPGEVS
ncbi:MAG: hypothetical protein WC683_01545 [bacterium]